MTIRSPEEVRALADAAREEAEASVPKPKPTTGSKPTTKKKTGVISLTFSQDLIKAGSEKRFEKNPPKVVPSFIKGGTPAQKAAYARKIANMTIDGKTMAASDIRAIKKARMWYTGQEKGAVKGVASYGAKSVKASVMGKPSAGQTLVSTTRPKGNAGTNLTNRVAKDLDTYKPIKPPRSKPNTKPGQGR